MKTADNSSQPPYQRCLITVLPEELQLPARDFANHVVIPINVVLSTMATLCNGFVVVTVARTKSLQRPSLLMLCSLALTDLLYSFYFLSRCLEFLTDEYFCPKLPSVETITFSALCLIATLGTLAVISQDRYLALNKPYWYRNHVTTSRAFYLICGTWLASATSSILIYFSRKSVLPIALAQIFYYLFCFVCVLMIIFSYLGVFCRRNPPGNVILIPAILEREKLMANTVAVILFLFLVTFVPGILLALVPGFARNVNVQANFPFTGFFLLLNSLLNPLLNFRRSKEMRRALRNLLRGPQEVQPLATFNFHTARAESDANKKKKTQQQYQRQEQH